MRLPEIINKEIQQLDTICLNAKELSLQFPHDNILRLNLEQSEFRKNTLMNELDESLKYFGRHSLKYIFKDIQDKINLNTLLENLSSFKGLIDKTFEKVTNGKSNHLPVYFNTVFSGSYGIQLSTPFEEKLLDHDFEKAINETLTIVSDLTTSDEQQLKEILAKDFGDDRKLLNKYSLFFKKIHQSDKKVEIVWTSPNTNQIKKVEVEPQKAKLLHSIFSQKEKTQETIQLIGILKGLSLIRYKVEFVKDIDGKDFISAKFDEGLSEEVIDLIDKFVIAKFKVTIEYNEMKDEEEKKYELIELKQHG